MENTYLYKNQDEYNIPIFSQPIKTAVKTRKYNINNINIYKLHAMTRIMADLWVLCLK